MAGLPARSAKSRYQEASSRSFDGLVSVGSVCMGAILRLERSHRADGGSDELMQIRAAAVSGL